MRRSCILSRLRKFFVFGVFFIIMISVPKLNSPTFRVGIFIPRSTRWHSNSYVREQASTRSRPAIVFCSRHASTSINPMIYPPHRIDGFSSRMIHGPFIGNSIVCKASKSANRHTSTSTSGSTRTHHSAKQTFADAVFHYSARANSGDCFEVCIATNDMRNTAWQYAHRGQLIVDGTFGICNKKILLFILMGVDKENHGVPLIFLFFSAPSGKHHTAAGYNTKILTKLLAVTCSPITLYLLKYYTLPFLAFFFWFTSISCGSPSPSD